MSKTPIYKNDIFLSLMAISGLLALYFALKTETVKGWLKPVIGVVTSPFGNRTSPITGKTEFHNGIDLGIPVGTPIKAPMPGVVESSWFDSANGNGIRIMHKNGYSTGYAHLSERRVNKGDKIKQGQIIGLSGNTGMSTGAHLHFNLKDPSGNYIDPKKYIYQV